MSILKFSICLLLVANGPKDHIAEQEDFESWRSTQQHHQGYTTPISTTSDPYTMSNYYNSGFTGNEQVDNYSVRYLSRTKGYLRLSLCLA